VNVYLDLMTGKPELAYDVYCRMDIGTESLMLLHFIANECYKVPSPGCSTLLYDRYDK